MINYCIEILQRHKEAKDAEIISNDEFLKIYNDIILNGVGSKYNSNSSSSSSSSSSFIPPLSSPPVVLKNKSNKRKLLMTNNIDPNANNIDPNIIKSFHLNAIQYARTSKEGVTVS